MEDDPVPADILWLRVDTLYKVAEKPSPVIQAKYYNVEGAFIRRLQIMPRKQKKKTALD